MATELYQLAISGTHAQEYFENVMYYEGDGVTPGEVIPSAQDLVESFLDTPLAQYLALLPETVEVMRLTARRISASGGVNVVRQFQQDEQVGAVSDAAQSQQLCPSVRLIPPMGTKSAGRVFLPAIAKTDINNNTPAPSWFTRITTLFTTLTSGFASGSIDWKLAIYSKKNNSHTLALDWDVSPVIGWQRRRQRPY